MKKIIINILLFILIISFQNFTNATDILQGGLFPAEKELKGHISIPSRNGEWEEYSNIYTYDELYSVLEDTNGNYLDLLDEYYELEDNVHEIKQEYELKIDELKKYIDELEQKNADLNTNLDSLHTCINIVGVILLLYIITNMAKETYQNKFIKHKNKK